MKQESLELLQIVREDGIPEPDDTETALNAILVHEGIFEAITQSDYNDLYDMIEYIPSCTEDNQMSSQIEIINEIIEAYK